MLITRIAYSEEQLDRIKQKQYALGYKAGLEAAVIVFREQGRGKIFVGAAAAAVYDIRRDFEEILADLPMPEVQWRDLTDEELKAFHHIEEFGLFCDVEEFIDIARAVIAKFKEKNSE